MEQDWKANSQILIVRESSKILFYLVTCLDRGARIHPYVELFAKKSNNLFSIEVDSGFSNGKEVDAIHYAPRGSKIPIMHYL